MIRTFIAVELGDDLRRAFGDAQQQLKALIKGALPRHARDVRVQWVRPESIHLTLKFLGDVDESSVLEIEEAMSVVGEVHSSFSLDIGGMGVFPDIRGPRVLWVGIQEPDRRLTNLAGDLDQALNGQGFPLETRPFRAHLTLGRVKEQARQVGQALVASGALKTDAVLGSCAVAAMVLMKSELRPSGAIYTRLKQIPLKKV